MLSLVQNVCTLSVLTISFLDRRESKSICFFLYLIPRRAEFIASIVLNFYMMCDMQPGPSCPTKAVSHLALVVRHINHNSSLLDTKVFTDIDNTVMIVLASRLHFWLIKICLDKTQFFSLYSWHRQIKVHIDDLDWAVLWWRLRLPGLGSELSSVPLFTGRPTLRGSPGRARLSPGHWTIWNLVGTTFSTSSSSRTETNS